MQMTANVQTKECFGMLAQACDDRSTHCNIGDKMAASRGQVMINKSER